MQIAFFAPAADGVVVPTAYAASLWAPGTLNGPAVCALAAHRAENEFNTEEFAAQGFSPARFTIDLFRAAPDLPTSTRGRLIRAGRRIRVVEIDVVAHPEPAHPDRADSSPAGSSAAAEILVARSTTVFLRRSKNPPGERWQRPASSNTFQVPQNHADDYAPMFASDDPSAETTAGRTDAVGSDAVGSDAAGTDVAGVWDTNMGAHQNKYRKRLWSRAAPAVAGHPLTPFVRAVISAESTSLICNWGSSGIGFINCDLTVALSRLPVGDRVGVEADTHIESDGISASTAGLYDEDGMFGVGAVTAVNNAAAEIDFTSVDLRGRYREA